MPFQLSVILYIFCHSCVQKPFNFSFTFHLSVYFLLGEYIGTRTHEVHIYVKHRHSASENMEPTKVSTVIRNDMM